MDYLRFFGVAPRLNPRCILLGGFHFVSKPISYCERVNHFTQLETGWRAVAGSWPWTDRGSGVAAGNPEANSWPRMDRACSLSTTLDFPQTNRRRGWDKTVDRSRTRLMRRLRRAQRTGHFVGNCAGISSAALSAAAGTLLGCFAAFARTLRRQ